MICNGMLVMELNEYQCARCKRNHVKRHLVKNMEVFFCLNCDDWIKEKDVVFTEGWTLFDESGFLRHDV